MDISVEISKYPLADGDYVSAIKDFIVRVNQYPDIEIVTNYFSTQIFGEYAKVMGALNAEMKTSFEKFGTGIFVCKFIPGNLKEKYAE